MDLLNAAYHRTGEGSVRLKTLADRFASEGRKIGEILDAQAAEVLSRNGFNPQTALPESIGDGIRQSPQEAEKASEKFRDVIEAFNRDREDSGKIKSSELVGKTETDPSRCVYISIDDVGVSHQKEKRKAGGSKTGKVVENTVVHIGFSGSEYRIAAVGMDRAFSRLLAFLLSNGLLSGRKLVFFSDGASNIRCALEKYFAFRPYTHYLDWFHLEKRMYEFISMAIKGKKESKQELREKLDNRLWAGNVQDAIDFLSSVPSSQVKNKKILDDAVAYLERKKPFITCYALRKLLGYRNSSNPGEKSNDILCAQRQKHNGMSWSTGGSESLTVITALMKNQEYENYLRTGKIPFTLLKRCA